MRAYAKIIVEQLQGHVHWVAWFEGLPTLAEGGEWPSDAIDRLLLVVGESEFIREEIFAIDSACTETHQEFFIPFKQLRKLPKTSPN